MQTAVLTGAVVFTVLAVLCQLPASGKKKITAIGCVIVAGIGVVVCSGLSEAGQLQVLRSPARKLSGEPGKRQKKPDS